MKNVIKRCSFLAIIASNLCVLPAYADLEIGASVQIHAKAEFDAPLATHGAWVQVGSYGRCWRPAGVGLEWRPYCSGEWVWTDCGWYWSAHEPWAWACYHYGGWVHDSSVGWVWVPDVVWAPAWVSWRVGGGYIGWAPLGPPGFRVAVEPRPELFVFVGSGRFGGPVRSSTLIVNNTTIIKQTTVIGGVKRESHNLGNSAPQHVMANHGPSLDMVQKASGKTFTAVPIREAAARTTARTPTKRATADTDRGGGREKDNSLADDRASGKPDNGDAPGRDNVRSNPELNASSHHSGSGSYGGKGHGRGR